MPAGSEKKVVNLGQLTKKGHDICIYIPHWQLSNFEAWSLIQDLTQRRPGILLAAIRIN